MELNIKKNNGIRIIGDHEKNNFIDVRGVGYNSMAIDLYGQFKEIEHKMEALK